MDKATTSKSTTKKSQNRRSRSPLLNLIKCFCGTCECEFERKHVEQAIKANETEILRELELRKILGKYLEFIQAGSHIKSPVAEILQCYELCEAIQNGTKQLDDYKDDLEDLCFTESWEEQLDNSIEEGTLDEFLRDLMAECTRRLGEQPDYQMFKEELHKKLNKKF